MLKYDYIISLQEAINMTVAEKRIVRYLSPKPNLDLRKEIVDIKGCKLRKPDRLSVDVAVIPPGIDPDTFDFGQVDMGIVL